MKAQSDEADEYEAMEDKVVDGDSSTPVADSAT